MLRDHQLEDFTRIKRAQAKEELYTDMGVVNRLQKEHQEEIQT